MKASINKYLISGPKFRQRFLCEVRVTGFPYVGAGNSTNKKDAEKNASKDFVNFLVRTGKIREADVPVEGFAGGADQPVPGPSTSYGAQQQEASFGSQSGNLSNFEPNQLGQVLGTKTNEVAKDFNGIS